MERIRKSMYKIAKSVILCGKGGNAPMSVQLTKKPGIVLVRVLKKKNAKSNYREPGRKTNGFIYYSFI